MYLLNFILFFRKASIIYVIWWRRGAHLKKAGMFIMRQKWNLQKYSSYGNICYNKKNKLGHFIKQNKTQ